MRLGPFSAPLLASLAAIVLAAVVAASQVAAVVGALFAPGGGGDATAARIEELLRGHEADRAAYLARFKGRSLFFMPAAPATPRPPPPPRPDVPESVPTVEGPRTPPLQYHGPSIVYILGDEVCFHGGLRVRVGEEKDGLKVIASNPPWSVFVGHSGGEYEVELLKRTFPGLETDPSRVQRPATTGFLVVGPDADKPQSQE
jgi:hypothetical protein